MSGTPRISVIVPVHNRAALTASCLDALLATLPPGCEAIVVDDASTDSTPELLAGYGEAIRTVRLERNGGYARACNAGAEAARGEALLFLNNDTEPRPGWLEAMARYAEEHPAAAVVGARLLYPGGVVQHAGVTIGQDGYPHNLYAGFPAEHAAVNRSRRLQAVTGACMLVRRDAFEAAGGFDGGYLNSLEDVDLCLRIGEAGGEVHYCHEAVVTHLESASRGRLDRFERSLALYRERWRERVRRDDLSIYAEDGLIEVEYADSYPLRLSVSPRLAAVAGGREPEVERLLEAYARQVSDLMAEVVRLTAAVGSRGRERRRGERFLPSLPERSRGGASDAERREFLREAGRLEAEVRGLQDRLAREEAEAEAAAEGEGGEEAFAANPRLGYRRLVEQVRAAVEEAVPAGTGVLVVSRGDRELVDLAGREAGHFPQGDEGGYLGHHPADSEEAIDRLEALRAGGAGYLVLPSASYWWLDHYDGFARHLRERYAATDLGVCTIFDLGAPTAAEPALPATEAVAS
ncbi:MAG TPA: glycosyltransferase family 2 protein [Solirubrobacterales bacterium]|nr:glycosyltransferase family 2 protein [Solirubrobacterales bacterium]